MACTKNPEKDSLDFYFRCPQGFSGILEDDMKKFSGKFQSIKPKSRFNQGIQASAFPVDAAAFCYFNQAIEHAIIVLATTKDTSPKGIKKALHTPAVESKLSELLPEKFTFSTEIIGETASIEGAIKNELAKEVAEELEMQIAGKGLLGKHSYRSPDVVFSVAFDTSCSTNSEPTCIIGIDLSGRDLSKRTYKITNAGASIKGTLAYCLVRLLNPAPGSTILDPSCGTGEICVEAALHSTNSSPWAFEKVFAWQKLPPFKDITKEAMSDWERLFGRTEQLFRILCLSPSFGHLATARKHSKIAGVEKHISFSRMQYEWLDAKFSRGEVDGVVSVLAPSHGGMAPEQKLKEAEQVFYQLEYLTRKGARAILISQGNGILEAGAAKYKFKKLGEIPAFMGSRQISIQEYQNSRIENQKK